MKLGTISVIGESSKDVPIEIFRDTPPSDRPVGQLLLKLLNEAHGWSDEYEVHGTFGTKECRIGVFSQLEIRHPEFSDEPALVIHESDDLSMHGVQMAIVKHIQTQIISLNTGIKVLEKQKTKLASIGDKLVADCKLK